MRESRHVSDYVRLQRSREARLWVATTIGAVFAVANYLETHPEYKQKVEDKWESFSNRFRKNPKIKVVVPDKEN